MQRFVRELSVFIQASIFLLLGALSVARGDNMTGKEEEPKVVEQPPVKTPLGNHGWGARLARRSQWPRRISWCQPLR